MSAPRDWLELDRAHVWHPYTQMATALAPLPVVGAHGCWLELADGRRLLDGISSWWVNLHGHNEPALNAALAAQAARLAQVVFAGFTHESAARLAAELARRTGLPRVFYSDDGSTAVEVAMKMAVQLARHRGEPERTLFVALEHAYHGDTFGAMAAGGSATFHGAFRDLLCEVRRIPAPAPPGTPRAGRRAAAARALAALEELLAREGRRVAALIVEPIVQGAGGMLISSPEFLAGARAATRRHGVLLIADEVFTGFGRTGRFLAGEHAGVEPDLLCLSKALTGGYLPLAATLASAEVYDAFLSEDRGRTFFHGHSFTGNALSTAVALASLRLFDERHLLVRVDELELLCRERLRRLARHPAVGDVRGVGGLAVVELAAGGGYLDPRGPRLAAALAARGVFVRPLGDVVYFLPPLAITDDEVAFYFDALEAALGEI